MNSESGQRYSTEELKAINAKRQALRRNTAQQNPKTQSVPTEQIPEQTQTPLPQPIVIHCGMPETMERLEQRLRTLEQINSTQVTLLRRISESGTPYPTWEQMRQLQDSLRQITYLLEQAGKPKEKRSWLRLPRVTLPDMDWPVVIMVLMMLAALVMIWLCLGETLNGWASLLR